MGIKQSEKIKKFIEQVGLENIKVYANPDIIEQCNTIFDNVQEYKWLPLGEILLLDKRKTGLSILYK